MKSLSSRNVTKPRKCHVSREWGLLAESGTNWLQSCAARTTSANAKWSKADVTLYDPSVPGSAPSKALKALVRQGIPDDLRPDLWLLFSGGLAKKKAAPPGHYALLLRKAAQGASGVCIYLFSSAVQVFSGRHQFVEQYCWMSSLLKSAGMQGRWTLRP